MFIHTLSLILAMRFRTKLLSKDWYKIYFKPATIGNNYFWIFIIVFALVSILISFLKDRINDDFWLGVLVEATGFLFDIFLFGIIYTVFDFISNKRRLIVGFLNEIEFFKTWESEEASHRIAGNIKLLNNENYTKIDFTGIKLSHVNLRGCSLSESYFLETEFYQVDFRQSNFSNTLIIFSEFEYCYFNNSSFKNLGEERCCSYFRNCFLSDCDFSGSYLGNINFEDCIISGCNFSDCDMEHATFRNCIVESKDWMNELNISEHYHTLLDSKYLIEEVAITDDHSMLSLIKEDYGKYYIRYKDSEIEHRLSEFRSKPFRNKKTKDNNGYNSAWIHGSK